MKIKLGGSQGKCWEFDNVQSFTVSDDGQHSIVRIDVSVNGLIYKLAFHEAGTIRIDNRKEKAAQS
jgi:hypothetical protein